MAAFYNVKVIDSTGKVGYVFDERTSQMSWRFHKCDQVIAAASKLARYAGCTFEKELA